ncbi:MAG TPA: 4a-hydroxytetrahydrobiopterin dehydratase [Steroidobacteraceae bacterium]|nr:4a-hydroxytetrahydrobiopterin dehydratase [Steroidobacteraceae bacterium]
MTTPLRDRRCRALPSGTPPLQDEQSVAMLAQLDPAWRISEDGKSLRRAFGFKDFYRTMAFLNAVAWIANAEDHHPDLEAGYNYCRLAFSTHSIGGLSENDFICAAKIDAL